MQLQTRFSPRGWIVAEAIHEAGAVPLALAIGLAVVTVACRLPEARPVRAVAALGRVAFTAYLMQSVVGTLYFGGHGLGAFGTWGRAALFAGALGFWLVQAALANVWARAYEVGPLEALWRGLSRGDYSLRPRGGAPL